MNKAARLSDPKESGPAFTGFQDCKKFRPIFYRTGVLYINADESVFSYSAAIGLCPCL